MVHGLVGCLRSQVSYVFEKENGGRAGVDEVDEIDGSYRLLGGVVTQPTHPLPAMSKSPLPLSIAAGKFCAGVPTCSMAQ